MPVWRFAFAPEGPERLTISIVGSIHTLRLDGVVIGTFHSKEMTGGRWKRFPLSDGSVLELTRIPREKSERLAGQLVVQRDDKPLTVLKEPQGCIWLLLLASLPWLLIITGVGINRLLNNEIDNGHGVVTGIGILLFGLFLVVLVVLLGRYLQRLPKIIGRQLASEGAEEPKAQAARCDICSSAGGRPFFFYPGHPTSRMVEYRGVAKVTTTYYRFEPSPRSSVLCKWCLRRVQAERAQKLIGFGFLALPLAFLPFLLLCIDGLYTQPPGEELLSGLLFYGGIGLLWLLGAVGVMFPGIRYLRADEARREASATKKEVGEKLAIEIQKTVLTRQGFTVFRTARHGYIN